MSETRSSRKRKAKAKAAAAASPEAKRTASPKAEAPVAAAPAVAAAPTTPKRGGKKPAKKAPPPPASPQSPSPQKKKKKKKRVHKRKGSAVGADAGDAGDAVAVETVEELPKPKTPVKQEAHALTPPAKKKKGVKQQEELAPSPAPKAASTPTKSTRKRKNRSGSIGAREEAAESDTRRLDVVTTQAPEPATPKGRTTRAALAAAAAAASAGDHDDAPESTTKPKNKKRKTKATRSTSAAEPTPEPESKVHEPPVPLRKSARLAHEEATAVEPLAPVKPIRKIVSLAKVKGKVPAQDTGTESSTQQDDTHGKRQARGLRTTRLATPDAPQNPTPTESRKGESASSSTDSDERMETEEIDDEEERAAANVEPHPLEMKDDMSTPVEETQNVDDAISTREDVHSSPVESDEELAVETTENAEEGREQQELESSPTAPNAMELEEEAPAATMEDAETRVDAAVEEGNALANTMEKEMEAQAEASEEEEEQHEPMEEEEAKNVVSNLLVEDDEDEAPPDAMLDGGLAFLGTSSVESVADDSSYQASLLDEENKEDATSEDEQLEWRPRGEGGQHGGIHDVPTEEQTEDADAPMEDEAASEGSIHEDEVHPLDAEHMNDDAVSEGSIHGSEQFTLQVQGEQEDDDAEYESLGVCSASQDREHEPAVDESDDGDGHDSALSDDDRLSTSSISNVVARHSSLHSHDSDDEEEEVQNDSVNHDQSGGLDDSFVDDGEASEDLTESDEEDVLTGSLHEAISTRLPGLDLSVRSASDEVIILSDSDSDDDGEEANVQNDEDALDSGDEGDDELDMESASDNREGDHRSMEISNEPALLSLSSRYEGGETSEAERHDAHIGAFHNNTHSEQEEEPEEQIDDEEHALRMDAYLPAEAPLSAEGNQDEETAVHDMSLSRHDEPLGNESDGTVELNDDDDDAEAHDDHTDDTSVEDQDNDNVDVQRTLFTDHTAAQPRSPTPAVLETPTQTPPALPSTGGEEPRSSTELAVAAGMPLSERSPAQAITYTTTPSKHLIDSVLSASQEQILANITQAALATPEPRLRRPVERSWGPSFGLSISSDAASASPDTASQAGASPLSSWFFSRGPANFKKRVLIPTPGSPRTRLGSPRPRKIMRVESPTPNNSESLDQSESGTDRLVQRLMDKSSWRGWYSTTKPDQLLDPPLPKDMVQRLGGDAALALLTHPSLTSSDSMAEPSVDAVTVPKMRRRALAQLEASIQEEKKRTKAFDDELLQLLQGKTLSGRDLTEEFAPLLPPSTSHR